MFNVVAHTFEWGSLRVIFFSMLPLSWRSKFGDHAEYKIQRSDAMAIVIVTVVTLISDLAIAVICGTIFSCCCHAWAAGESLYVDIDEEDGKKLYIVHGNLFFASVEPFLDSFNPKEDPKEIIIRFEHSAINDFSGLEAINVLIQRYNRVEKSVKIERLTDELSINMLKKAGNLLTGDMKTAVESVQIDKNLTHFSQMDRGKKEE